MLVRPIATEKAYREQTKHSYMFIVPANASKQLSQSKLKISIA